jgi:hypothetical protein
VKNLPKPGASPHTSDSQARNSAVKELKGNDAITLPIRVENEWGRPNDMKLPNTLTRPPPQDLQATSLAIARSIIYFAQGNTGSFRRFLPRAGSVGARFF